MTQGNMEGLSEHIYVIMYQMKYTMKYPNT